MAFITAAKIEAISQAKDPKQAIIDAVGDLSKESILWDLVLVGTYIRPEMTKGGIIRPKENVAEDAYQGKAGVILKFGEGVDNIWNLQEGDWIAYSIKDGMSVTLNETPCRLISYEKIRMKVSDPNMVF